MRSRYSAYVLEEIDYLVSTHDPDGSEPPDRASIAAWARRAKWQGLTILNTEGGRAEDETGVVEFSARYLDGGVPREHRERSEFQKIAGQWRYTRGTDTMSERSSPVRARAPGRNDPCPCGSGKKFKKCCGANA